VYFDVLFRYGACIALGAMVGTQHWFLLGWAVLMLLYYFVQRIVPSVFTANAAREAFSVALLIQGLLTICAAIAMHGVGIFLIAVGMVANCAVVLANGGCMPTSDGYVPNDCYVEADENTCLPWLADIFPATSAEQAVWVISIGDALECIGVWVLAAELFLQ